MDSRYEEVKQFAIVVEGPFGTPDYVDAHNPRMTGHTSVINPPPAHYTYTLLEMKEAVARLRKCCPDARIEAHEVEHIDHSAMRKRWGEAYRKRKNDTQNYLEAHLCPRRP